MPGDGHEVLIRAQQLDVGGDARVGDETVDRSVNSDAVPSQESKETGGGDVTFDVQGEDRQLGEQLTGEIEVSVMTKSLEDFGHDDGRHTDVLVFEGRVQPADLGCRSIIEPVGPHGAVDDDHRERRHASMSPCHASLPFKRRSAR